MSDVQHVRVPAPHVIATVRQLRARGADGYECLVLWLGRVEADIAVVVEALVPRQESIRDEDGVGYMVTGETLFEVGKYLADTSLRLIAQVHSHPRDAYHSSTDDRYAVATAEGCLSFVVPDFGFASPDPLTWAVYRLDAGQWVALDPRSVATLVVVVPSE